MQSYFLNELQTSQSSAEDFLKETRLDQLLAHTNDFSQTAYGHSRTQDVQTIRSDIIDLAKTQIAAQKKPVHPVIQQLP